jgi:hypothetical protein
MEKEHPINQQCLETIFFHFGFFIFSGYFQKPIKKFDFDFCI